MYGTSYHSKVINIVGLTFIFQIVNRNTVKTLMLCTVSPLFYFSSKLTVRVVVSVIPQGCN